MALQKGARKWEHACPWGNFSFSRTTWGHLLTMTIPKIFFLFFLLKRYMQLETTTSIFFFWEHSHRYECHSENLCGRFNPDKNKHTCQRRTWTYMWVSSTTRNPPPKSCWVCIYFSFQVKLENTYTCMTTHTILYHGPSYRLPFSLKTKVTPWSILNILGHVQW
jgi:hypothetical protein